MYCTYVYIQLSFFIFNPLSRGGRGRNIRPPLMTPLSVRFTFLSITRQPTKKKKERKKWGLLF